MKLTYSLRMERSSSAGEWSSVYIKFPTMDESLRGKGALFTASNGMSICSVDGPELRAGKIYIPGVRKNSDTIEVVYKTKTPKARMIKIKAAMDEFLNHLYKNRWEVTYIGREHEER